MRDGPSIDCLWLELWDCPGVRGYALAEGTGPCLTDNGDRVARTKTRKRMSSRRRRLLTDRYCMHRSYGQSAGDEARIRISTKYTGLLFYFF